MRKIIPLMFCCLALIILLGYGPFKSIAANNYAGNPPQKETAIGCAPSPQSAQNNMSGPHASTSPKGDFRISTFLSDDELSKFKYESFIFELGPGQSDTISHRHDCDVFVTVLEGTALLGQEFKEPVTIKAGEVFHEKRNVIHSVTINPSQDQKMKAFIVFIRKDGRAGYTPLYPKNK